MKFTDEMLAEDEKRWHARDVVIELGYCGKYMRDRKNMTNLDIRFYAYLMRKAHEILKAQEPVKPHRCILSRLGSDVMECHECGSCGKALRPYDKYCWHCGRAVKWDG